MKLSFDHVHYRCADMDKTVQWYQEVMDATFLEEVELVDNRAVRLALGGVLLAFFESPNNQAQPEPATSRLGAYHIAFTVENHDEAVAYYKSRGAVFFKEGLFATPKLKVAFIEAPDGMHIELMEKIPE